MKTKVVLVIDDNEDICFLVERTLKDTEFSVISANNCRKGFELAKNMQPDVLLLDIMMPDVDGLTMSGAMKKNPLTENIPIIFLTARRTIDSLHFAVQAGAVDYITKPFSPADIVKRLRRVTSK